MRRAGSPPAVSPCVPQTALRPGAESQAVAAMVVGPLPQERSAALENRSERAWVRRPGRGEPVERMGRSLAASATGMEARRAETRFVGLGA